MEVFIGQWDYNFWTNTQNSLVYQSHHQHYTEIMKIHKFIDTKNYGTQYIIKIKHDLIEEKRFHNDSRKTKHKNRRRKLN